MRGAGFYSGETRKDLLDVDKKYFETARVEVERILAGKRIANSNHIGSIVHRD